MLYEEPVRPTAALVLRVYPGIVCVLSVYTARVRFYPHLQRWNAIIINYHIIKN